MLEDSSAELQLYQLISCDGQTDLDENFWSLALEPSNFRCPNDWTKWKHCFDRYLIVSGLQKKSEELQINSLIYCMVDKAEDILASFELAEEDAKRYETVATKFKDHFNPKNNIIFERAKFNSRKQEEGEPADVFITALHTLSEHCDYRTLRNEMIRDRVVVGIRDVNLSEKLQLENDLTLENAIKKVCQSEVVKEQQTELRGARVGKSAAPIDALTRERTKRIPHTETKGFNKAEKCGKCGRTPAHSREHCPARDAICRKCKKRGHFQIVCRSPAKVSGVNDKGDEPDAFLGALGN